MWLRSPTASKADTPNKQRWKQVISALNNTGLCLFIKPAYTTLLYTTFAIIWPSKRTENTCIVIGFTHGLLGLAENSARGTCFWSQNTEGVARGVLREKARPEGWVFSQAQHPMIKTYYSMSLHCYTAKLLYYSQTISNSRIKEQVSTPDTVARQNRLLLGSGCLATYIIGKPFVHSMMWHNSC